MVAPLTRRRAITLAAAAVGLPLLLHGRGARARPLRWEGTTLGARATVVLYHIDETAARAAIAAAVAEVARLERIFSLYRADSAVTALNRSGHLAAAPSELIALMTTARRYAELSDGAFDMTVQPVWQLYLRHFTQADPDPTGPPPEALRRALALVDWRDVAIDHAAGAIRLARPGMGVTLNGIAQGYVTDRVADLLRAHGFDRLLVDMGEPRGLSSHPDGSPWRIGIQHPGDPAAIVATIEAVDKAVATSGGYGTLFDAAGRFSHLIDPRSGVTAPADYSVSVVADSAASADALSTALAVAPTARRRAILAAAGPAEALFVDSRGSVTRLAG